MFATAPTQTLTQVELGAIPLSLLMGPFAGAAGLSANLYRLFNAFVGHFRGGLAMSTTFKGVEFGRYDGVAHGDVVAPSDRLHGVPDCRREPRKLL